MDKIYLRLLKETDAAISWKWRNDPEVWKHTGNKPDRVITYEIELDWIRNVLNRNDEIRFAICEKDTDNYIGNVQLTSLNSNDAEFHIFIGDKKFWGRGFGSAATRLMVEYGFETLKLKSIFLDVKEVNLPAIKAYYNVGFRSISRHDGYSRMVIFGTGKIKEKVSVCLITYNHEGFISQAIESVLSQKTDFPLELIIGEDCSSDSTYEICKKYKEQYPGLINLLPKLNKNVGANKNFIRTLSASTGKYIALLEGDDYWTDPLKLKKQIEFLEDHTEYSLCCHAYNVVDENNALVQTPTSDLEDKFKSGFEITIEKFFERWVTKTLTTVIRRDAINFNYSKCSHLSDSVLFFNVLMKNKGYWMNFNGGNYRSHINGVWSNLSVKKQLIFAYHSFIELFKDHKNVLALREALLDKVTQILDFIMHNDNRNELNVRELFFFSHKHYVISIDKKKSIKYLMNNVGSILLSRLKIRVRMLFDRKFRISVQKYRAINK